MNSRHLLKPVLIGALAASGPALAHAEGFYVGASLGVSQFTDQVHGVDSAGSSVSGKLFGGYHLNPNFALEAGVADLGWVSNGTGSIKSHGEYVDAVGLLPLGGNFSLLGRVGVAHVS